LLKSTYVLLMNIILSIACSYQHHHDDTRSSGSKEKVQC
jgi:hypothetical protein